MLSNGTITSGSLGLPRYLAQPGGNTAALPGVIMCHSFPLVHLMRDIRRVVFQNLWIA